MPRGSTGAQLSREARSGAIRHVAALESTSMSKRADVLGMPVLLSPTPPLATEGGGRGRSGVQVASSSVVDSGSAPWVVAEVIVGSFWASPTQCRLAAGAPPWRAAVVCRGFDGAGSSSWLRDEPPG
jgi:hypothetical protein